MTKTISLKELQKCMSTADFQSFVETFSIWNEAYTQLKVYIKPKEFVNKHVIYVDFNDGSGGESKLMYLLPNVSQIGRWEYPD